MPSEQQLRQLWFLSDDVLYPEAVAFMQRLVNEQGHATLPASQVMGLLNIANASIFSELLRFIRHQQERTWPESKKDIPVFYAGLEKWLTTFRNRRLKDVFDLGPGNQEVDELMALVSRDFIQHLVVENGILAVRKTSPRTQPRVQKR